MSGTGLQANFPEAVGPALAVTPGQSYTASMDISAASFPSNQVMLFLKVTNTSGGERKQASEGTRWAVSAANRTEECTIFFTAEDGDAHASLVLALYNYGNDTGPSTGTVTLSNPYFGAGNTVREPASTKRAFNAITDPVHISVDGTWYVNGAPYFMKAMYVGNTRQDYTSLVKAGWNTNMWASAVGTVALGKKVGMRSMIQLAEYGLTGFWGSGNISTVLGRLDKAWADMVAAGVDDHAIGWYWDNENRCARALTVLCAAFRELGAAGWCLVLQLEPTALWAAGCGDESRPSQTLAASHGTSSCVYSARKLRVRSAVQQRLRCHW